jgi:hypothetical protein
MMFPKWLHHRTYLLPVYEGHNSSNPHQQLLLPVILITAIPVGVKHHLMADNCIMANEAEHLFMYFRGKCLFGTFLFLNQLFVFWEFFIYSR